MMVNRSSLSTGNDSAPNGVGQAKFANQKLPASPDQLAPKGSADRRYPCPEPPGSKGQERSQGPSGPARGPRAGDIRFGEGAIMRKCFAQSQIGFVACARLAETHRLQIQYP